MDGSAEADKHAQLLPIPVDVIIIDAPAADGSSAGPCAGRSGSTHPSDIQEDAAMIRLNHALSSLAVAALLAACGGGGGSDSTPPVTVAAPVITTEPISSTANVGGTVTLSVVASGTGLSYQWRLNGADIAGATAATYTTPVLAAGDTGKSYTVVVSNGGGTDTSVAAVLTVNPVAAAAIALNQASANQLVADVNAGVSRLRQADALDRLPLPFGARIASLPLGAVVT
jgi:hypothetical protein